MAVIGFLTLSPVAPTQCLNQLSYLHHSLWIKRKNSKGIVRNVNQLSRLITFKTIQLINCSNNVNKKDRKDIAIKIKVFGVVSKFKEK